MRMGWKSWQWLGLAVLLSGPLQSGQAGELTGELVWGERVSMGTLVSGMISETPVRAGQRVKKGDLLVGLDERGFRADLDSARVLARSARALLGEAKLEDERAAELYDRTLLSEHERAAAILGLRQAEADAAQANAALTQARLAHERSQLKAPFDGLVLAVHAAPGQSVVSEYQSAPLVEVANDSRMLLRVSADLSTARDIVAAGPKVEVGGRLVAADLVEIGYEPLSRSQGQPLYAVSVYFPRPGDLELRAGEAAKLVW